MPGGNHHKVESVQHREPVPEDVESDQNTGDEGSHDGEQEIAHDDESHDEGEDERDDDERTSSRASLPTGSPADIRAFPHADPRQHENYPKQDTGNIPVPALAGPEPSRLTRQLSDRDRVNYLKTLTTTLKEEIKEHEEEIKMYKKKIKEREKEIKVYKKEIKLLESKR